MRCWCCNYVILSGSRVKHFKRPSTLRTIAWRSGLVKLSMNTRLKFFTTLLLITIATSVSSSESQISVQGLFGGAAVISADGQEFLLKRGQERHGIRLLEADSEKAVVSIDGKTLTLYLSQHIGSTFAAPGKNQVHINMNSNRQYITTGSINGRSASFLVDTGANVIAINAQMAKLLGISLYDGVETQVVTASGTRRGIHVFLKEVMVGSIRRNNVAAVVIDGDHPREILLGMSFLQHVDMSENGKLMVLTSKL